MKVWIVERQEFYSSEVVGVFSEEQKASNFMDAQEALRDRYEVYEVEVDYLCK